MNNNNRSIIGVVLVFLFVAFFIGMFFTGSFVFTSALIPLFVILPLIFNVAKRNSSNTTERFHPQMACKQCQKIIDRDSRFCKYCGTSVSEEFACEFCGEYNPKGTEYCSNCGAKLI